MSDGKPRSRLRRRLTDEERVLWKTVTRSVNPLRPSGQADEPPAEVVVAEAVTAAAPAPRSQHVTKAAAPARPPSLAPLERRLTQRVARGNRAIEARLDLHGLTQQRAHGVLLRFLSDAQAQGATMVLVITGKGLAGGNEAYAHSERGVLKRQVPQWLRLPEFRTYVVGFQTAHVTHGGEGALYVRIRRARKS